jgi:2-isopropylmalate synthase
LPQLPAPARWNAINGLGEQGRNASLEEIVMALHVRKNFLKSGPVTTEEIYKASRLVSGVTGIAVQPNKAIVGVNAFAHESGIHQDGILKDKRTYEIMTRRPSG